MVSRQGRREEQWEVCVRHTDPALGLINPGIKSPSSATGQRNWRCGIPSFKLAFALDTGQLFLSMGHSVTDVLMLAHKVQCVLSICQMNVAI